MNRTARPLSQTSSAALNSRAGSRSSASIATTDTKKRKRTESEQDTLALTSRERIVINSHIDASPQQVALELRVCQTISRLQLPLVYLDTSSDHDAYPRLFSGRIHALDEAQHGEQLLIAEAVANQRLFGIERVQEDIFALCALQPWVTLVDLGRNIKSRCIYPTREPRAKVERWWQPVSPPKSKDDSIDNEALIGLRRRFTMKRQAIKERVNPKLTLQNQSIDGLLQQTQEPLQIPGNPENTVVQEDIPSAELLAAIKTHYLDSLYIHRTPLAYFVKGPLSRARGGIKSGVVTGLQFQELVDFLRSHIMTLAMASKKYDESLAELIREIPCGLSPDDMNNQVTTPLKDRIRKSKKRKQLSKGGLLPGEEDYIVHWWVKREATSEYEGEDDTRESRIKQGLTDQRARETQLQIILILETLALEAVTTRGGLENFQSCSVTEEASKKKRKSIDLNSVLDVLIDRLCIWESMNLDAPNVSKNKSSDGNKKAQQILKDSESDYLRDFCTDIVVPFYATRLPDLYVSICQKLGGPSLTSSPPVTRTPAPKKTVKPGAAVTRAQPKKDKNATQESIVFRRTQAPLVRSATDSHLPSLKRELSEVDLSQLPRHRPSLHQSRRYSQREVDLPAAAAATEAKLARKAAAEQELKSAIAALRKPNARLAVKDFVESAEQHAAARASKSRKPKQPTRNPFATAVQVTATPKISRQTRDRTAYILPPPPGPVVARATIATSLEAIPLSSDSRVPSSSMKPAATSTGGAVIANPRADIMQTPLPQQRYVAVDATPSRKRAKVVPARRPSTSLTSGVPEMIVPALELNSSPQLPPPVQRTPESAFKRSVGLESAAKPMAQKQAPLEMFCTPVKALATARRVTFAAAAGEVAEDRTTGWEYGTDGKAGGGNEYDDDAGKNPEEGDDEDEDMDVVQLISSTPAKEAQTRDQGATPVSLLASMSVLTSAPEPAQVDILDHHSESNALAPYNTTRQGEVSANVKDSAVEPEPEPKESDNIYAMLGWDDDDAYD